MRSRYRPTPPPIRQLVLASGNAGKVQEIQAMLSEIPVEVLPQSYFNIAEVEETGLSFVENAILKARNAAHHSGLPAIGDDSGLEVDALAGAPGIYSARYAGTHADSAANNAKLLDQLKHIPEAERTARFRCVLVFMAQPLDPTPLIFQGTWEGRILRAPQGTQGFGYDPLFYVPAHRCSAAELSAEYKNQLSHRGQATRQFAAWLYGQWGTT